MPCLCCSGLPYKVCCRPYHKGECVPLSALALMRSRYCAYALGKIDYIIQTTHPQNPKYEKDKKPWRESLHRFSRETEFVKLEIEGFGDDWVAFTAHLKQHGKPFVLKEKSHFAKLDGKWLYLSGELSQAEPR